MDNETIGGSVNANSVSRHLFQSQPSGGDFQIEIDEVSPSSSLSAPRLPPTMPSSNISSFFNTGAVSSDRRGWGINFGNVISLSVRPLVQQAQTMNNLRRTWMPRPSTFRYVPVRDQGTEQNNPENISVHFNSSNESHPPLLRDHLPIDINNMRTSASARDEEDHSSSLAQPHIHQQYVTSPPTIPTHQNRDIPPLDATRNNSPDLINVTRQQQQQNNAADREPENMSEVFARVPELRGVLNTIGSYLPFLFIILIKSAYDHFKGVADVFMLNGVFCMANLSLKKQVFKQAQRSPLIVLRDIIIIASVISALYIFDSPEQTPLGILLFHSSIESISLSQLLFSIIITDFLLKDITIVLKNFVMVMPASMIKFIQRGRIFVFIEATSQLYRSLVPIQPWLIFLSKMYTGIETVFGIILSSIYIICKGYFVIDKLKFFKTAFVKLISTVKYGRQPTKDEIEKAGRQCPICHDDYDTPVLLHCGHVFCETCVGKWFIREKTCPLCRAKVENDLSWQDGATTHFIQLY